ncbi:MAG: FliH/SctL family protein [Lachnospiraceae bacterium]|nr:FliH/SctL family protein [Lachnospiraceae bacterium]
MTRSLSNVYRNNYVIRGEQVTRVINTNDMIAERMQAIVNEQKQAQRAELLRRREEAIASGEADGEPEFTEGLFAQELELEAEPEPQIDYVEQAKEQAQQILEEANAKAVMIHNKAMKEADTLREMGRQEGYQKGFESAVREADEKLQAGEEALAFREQELKEQYDRAMAELEPQLLDTILTVFEEVFRVQFSGKREMLLSLVKHGMRGIRETKQYKIRVSEAEVSFLRAHKEELQEKVGGDVQIDIVMDPDLSESQCVIDADSGVYDCSLDVALENLTRDLRSLCRMADR